MRTMIFVIGGPLLIAASASVATDPGFCPQDHRKGETGSDRPKADAPMIVTREGPTMGEDGLSAQELTDRFLVVRASLEKPGDNPTYELGEPIPIELDIRNMSNNQQFYINQYYMTELSPGVLAMNHVVEATLHGKPVQPTTLGRQSIELMKRNDPVLARYSIIPFDDDRVHPRFHNSHTEVPTRNRLIANVHCDMTAAGDYELVAKFNVGVLKISDGVRKQVNAMKVVRPTPPLRLKVSNRLYHLDRPPVEAAPARP